MNLVVNGVYHNVSQYKLKSTLSQNFIKKPPNWLGGLSNIFD